MIYSLFDGNKIIAELTLVSHSGGYVAQESTGNSETWQQEARRLPVVLHLLCSSRALIPKGKYKLGAGDYTRIPVDVNCTGQTSEGVTYDATVLDRPDKD